MREPESAEDPTVLAARLLLRAGRVEEAEKAWLAVLDRNPFDVQALNIVGLASIRLGQFHRARELLERAVARHPAHAQSHQHLGRAHEQLGDLETAATRYREAARLGGAQLPAARLHLAALLERQGRGDDALLQYARVMGEMQAAGRWLDPSTTPPALLTRVAHAAQVVRDGRRGLLERAMEPLVAEFGRTSLGRVERMLRVFLHEEDAAPSDPRQRPTFLFFPDLPTAPYLPRDVFPWLAGFEAQFPAIRAELDTLLAGDAPARERVFTSTAVEEQNLRGSRGAPSWTGHYFYRHGERRDAGHAAAPRTGAALDRLPLCHVRDHGPEVLFSVFTPGTELLPHCGVTNTRVVAHLPLVIPPDAALRVGGETHAWEEGRVVVFDDTYEHEAWNRSARQRVVLIFDLWNPWLTDAERAATARVVETLGDFRKAVEAA
jgi:aspartate beta-hydroxylase